jgi:hypothetical protein
VHGGQRDAVASFFSRWRAPSDWRRDEAPLAPYKGPMTSPSIGFFLPCSNFTQIETLPSPGHHDRRRGRPPQASPWTSSGSPSSTCPSSTRNRARVSGASPSSSPSPTAGAVNSDDLELLRPCCRLHHAPGELLDRPVCSPCSIRPCSVIAAYALFPPPRYIVTGQAPVAIKWRRDHL